MYIKNKENLIVEPNSNTRRYVLELLELALDFANPAVAIKRVLKFDRGEIKIQENKTIKIDKDTKIFVVGFGKASQQMAVAIERTFKELILEGVIITPYTTKNAVLEKIKVIEARHPLPDENSILGCKEVLNVLSRAREQDIIFVLISGGGSALFECPKAPITLEELQTASRQLLQCGADIHEINTVRKHISEVKGGQLLKHTKATIVSLSISDVVGDDLSVIASGPTVPDSTTYRDAYNILKKYNIWDNAPNNVKKVISMGINGELEETPKKDNLVFNKVINVLVSSNRLVLEKLKEKIIGDKKFNAFILTTRLVGEAKEVGKLLGSIALNIKKEGIPIKPPVILLLGGETTVTVRGTGKGGRNQELVLSALNTLKERMRNIIITSIGTDGIDGDSDAAGAIADIGTYIRAIAEDIKIDDYLKNNNSYEFFKKVGNSLIYTGYTGTNVNDITLIAINDLILDVDI